jgi:hypothetical protein
MAAAKAADCAAILAAGGWECQRCALAWDDGDTAPPCEPLTYARLIDACTGEAERLEQSQRALTAGPEPINKFRNQAMLKRACELRAMQTLIVKAKERGKGEKWE